MTNEEQFLQELSRQFGKEKILEMLEDQLKSIGGFHDCMAYYNDDNEGKLTVEVYPLPGDYRVYRYDGRLFTLRLEEDVIYVDDRTSHFPGKMDERVFEIVKKYFGPVSIWK